MRWGTLIYIRGGSGEERGGPAGVSKKSFVRVGVEFFRQLGRELYSFYVGAIVREDDFLFIHFYFLWFFSKVVGCFEALSFCVGCFYYKFWSCRKFPSVFGVFFVSSSTFSPWRSNCAFRLLFDLFSGISVKRLAVYIY